MTVLYDVKKPHTILFNLQRGSVVKTVVPYCLLNMILTWVVWYMQHVKGMNLAFPDNGHFFLGVLVAFLVVTRVNTSYNRFWEARNLLGKALGDTRKVSLAVAAFTSADEGENVMQWKMLISEQLVRLLRVTVDVLADENRSVELCEGSSEGRLGASFPENDSVVAQYPDEDPMQILSKLLFTISQHDEYLTAPVPPPKEVALLSPAMDFIATYQQLLKFAATPFPFAMVQMTSTILFIWLFSLPFALVDDIERLAPCLIGIALITYGFGGLQLVSIELHHPFGDDPNDFETMKLMEVIVGGIQKDLLGAGNIPRSKNT